VKNFTHGLDLGAGETSVELVRQRGEVLKEESEQMVPYRAHPVRTGEVAAELRSQQFHYPFGVQSTAVRALGEELVAAKDPFSDLAEQFRALRGELLRPVFSGAGRRALAVVSADKGDGKTYLVANLAISFSQYAGRTLLIDANLRNPRLHHLFAMSGNVGLSNLLAGEAHGHDSVPVAGLPGLHLLGAGSSVADPVQLLQGARFSVLLEKVVSSFEYVLIDTPSNDVGPDARLIAARAGAALLVGRKGHSRVLPLKRLLSQLNTGPSVVAGVVLNER
jgi:capsular exopolysaccharide synthesis family protein